VDTSSQFLEHFHVVILYHLLLKSHDFIKSDITHWLNIIASYQKDVKEVKITLFNSVIVLHPQNSFLVPLQRVVRPSLGTTGLNNIKSSGAYFTENTLCAL
jgi:hypothetical protein